jgi:hypothetical protein
MVHEVSRTDELAEWRRAHSAVHAGLEVEEQRAWYVFAARGPVVKHVNAAELRVVAAAVLTVAVDAVLVAQHLLNLGAHLATSLTSLHVKNLARRSSLEAESTREEKGGEERKNVKKNSVWKFGTGNRKCRRHARVYFEQEKKVILPLLLLEIWTPCKAR